MKIAIYYPGMLGTFKYCYKEVMKCFKGHEIYIFLSIWDIPGLSTKHGGANIYPELDYKNINEDLIKKEFPDVTFAVIDIEKYENSVKVMDTFQKGDPKVAVIKARRELSSQWYKIYKCNSYRKLYEEKTGIKFDWYMRCRPDGCVKSIPKLGPMKPTLFINKYVWEGGYNISIQGNRKETNEMVWLTNDSMIMDKYCNLLEKIKEVWTGHVYAEKLAYNHLKNNFLLGFVKLHDFKIEILRAHGNRQIMGKKRTW